MVATIKLTRNIRRSLQYNEAKVDAGKAALLSAHYFIKDPELLSFSDKIRSFEKQTALNESCVVNTLHLSLNFSPADRLDNNKMATLADEYMHSAGFGVQPYLVYRHFDAAHPHLHVVSTKVLRDGNLIPIQRAFFYQSKAITRALEVKYGLIQSGRKDCLEFLPDETRVNQKVLAGKETVCRAIDRVLNTVIPQYRYGSLDEFNAVLKLYNIAVKRCGQNYGTYQGRSLYYRVLDEHGHPAGPPVRASFFHIKPTLPNLEYRFTANRELRAPYERRVKTMVDLALRSGQELSLERFRELLGREQISVVFGHPSGGPEATIDYVDHKTKCVFNESCLGNKYGALGIFKRIQEGVRFSDGVQLAEKASMGRDEFHLAAGRH